MDTICTNKDTTETDILVGNKKRNNKTKTKLLYLENSIILFIYVNLPVPKFEKKISKKGDWAVLCQICRINNHIKCQKLIFKSKNMFMIKSELIGKYINNFIDFCKLNFTRDIKENKIT